MLIRLPKRGSCLQKDGLGNSYSKGTRGEGSSSNNYALPAVQTETEVHKCVGWGTPRSVSGSSCSTPGGAVPHMLPACGVWLSYCSAPRQTHAQAGRGVVSEGKVPCPPPISQSRGGKEKSQTGKCVSLLFQG